MTNTPEIDPKKEEIAETFRKHFDHFGYKKTSVDEVAKDLKISKKTIYTKFSSKEDIFYYIIKKVANRDRKKIEKEIEALKEKDLEGNERSLNSKEKISVLIQKVFERSRKWLSDKKTDPFEFKYKFNIARLAFIDAYQEYIKNLISDGINRGEFRDAPPDITYRFITGIIGESMEILQTNPEIMIEEETIDSVLRLLK